MLEWIMRFVFAVWLVVFLYTITNDPKKIDLANVYRRKIKFFRG